MSDKYYGENINSYNVLFFKVENTFILPIIVSAPRDLHSGETLALLHQKKWKMSAAALFKKVISKHLTNVHQMENV